MASKNTCFWKVLAVAASFAAGFASMEASAEVTIGGTVETRYFYLNNVNDAHTRGTGCLSSVPSPDPCDDQEAFFDQRFRIRLAGTAGIARGVVVTDFLNDVAVSSSTLDDGDLRHTGRRRLGADALGGVDEIVVREAFIQVNPGNSRIVVGRHRQRLGQGLLLDDSVDGLSVAFLLGPTSLTVSYLKLVETDASATGSSDSVDADLFTGNFALAPPGGWTFQVFFVHLLDRGPDLTLTPSRYDSGCGGASACPVSDYGDGKLGILAGGFSIEGDYPRGRTALEVDFVRGRLTTDTAQALNPLGRDARISGINALGSNTVNLGRFDLGLAGIYGTGQVLKNDPAAGGRKLNLNGISPNVVFGHILVNHETASDRDGGSLGNLLAGKGAIGFAFAPEIRAEVAVIWAMLVEKASPEGEKQLGYEVDTTIAYTIDSAVSWTSGLAVLLTGDAWPNLIGEAGAVDNMVKVFSKLTFAF